jgi:putative spermidine/putrescine transport system permease protein
VVAGGLVWPLARVCVAAFSRGAGEASGVARLFADGYLVRALVRSLAFSALIAVVAVAVCLPAALALARGRFPGRRLLRAVFAAPLALSGVVVGFLAVAMLGNAGALPSLLHVAALRGSAYGVVGLGAAYLYFEVPRAVLTLEAALAGVDERLLEAARTLGAGRLAVARLVFWPLSAPALRAAFGVTFAASLGSFGAALLLAGRFQLLPVELYRSFTGTLDEPLAAAMALVLALLAALVLSLGGRGEA